MRINIIRFYRSFNFILEPRYIQPNWFIRLIRNAFILHRRDFLLFHKFRYNLYNQSPFYFGLAPLSRPEFPGSIFAFRTQFKNIRPNLIRANLSHLSNGFPLRGNGSDVLPFSETRPYGPRFTGSELFGLPFSMRTWSPGLPGTGYRVPPPLEGSPFSPLSFIR